MKTLLSSIFLICGSTIAYATLTPAVGDSVTYHRKANYVSGEKEEYDFSIAISSYDKIQKKYGINICNRANCSLNFVPADSVEQAWYSELRITECVKQGGKIETVTVTAGRFQTCHFTEPDSESWSANIPFASVKSFLTFEDGTTFADELIKLEKH